MRAIFGMLSLLVVVAIVGLLVVRQLHAVGTSLSTATASAPESAAASAGGNVGQQARQLQSRVANDVAKALEQGAAARRDEPGQ